MICLVHQVEMKQWSKDGRTWYSHQLADGSYCKGGQQRAASPAVPNQTAPGTIYQGSGPATISQGGAPPNRSGDFAQRDRLMAAQSALKFAGEMYSGQPDKVGSAMALAHRIFAEFLMPCKNGVEFPSSVYDPDDWWERMKA